MRRSGSVVGPIRRAVIALAAALVLGACGSAAGGGVGARNASASGTPIAAAGGQPSSADVASAPRAAHIARWTAFVPVRRPLDLAGPRHDGAIVVAAAGRLMMLGPSGALHPFAGAYRSPGGEEPYIALPGSPRAGGCRYGAAAYALALHGGRGVSAISAQGLVRRLAALSAPGLIDGIAFDSTGAFGHRLLVTINAGSRTTVDAIDCRGAVTTITRDAPRVEGGIAVAPMTFGRFGGDLIVPDEKGGRIFAITPRGRSRLLAASGLPHGQDIGVESEAFVPGGPPAADALVADRLTPGNRHPGDDVVLRIRAAALRRAGVAPGDLLIATEGGARTDAISCGPRVCRVHHVADGPSQAHVEGHIAFLTAGPRAGG